MDVQYKWIWGENYAIIYYCYVNNCCYVNRLLTIIVNSYCYVNQLLLLMYYFCVMLIYVWRPTNKEFKRMIVEINDLQLFSNFKINRYAERIM